MPSRDLIVAGHQQLTKEWWRKQKDGFDIYISQFVIDEAGAGDPALAQERLNTIMEFAKLEITDDVAILAASMIDSGIIPRQSATDAAHIAVSAVHGMDYLMTWNCAHIANAAIVRKIEKICKQLGFDCPVICTPEELMGE